MGGRPWTPEEERFLKANTGVMRYKFIAAKLNRSVHACQVRAGKLGVAARKDSAAWRANLSCANQGKRCSPRTEFRKGDIPWNKGRKGLSIHPNCAKGWFRKGNRNNCVPVGTVSIRRGKKRGPPSRFIKVCDDGPPARRWVPLARFRYEHKHGPIPRGMFVVHRDGNSMNDEPDNFLLMDRQRLLAWQSSVRPKMEPRRRRKSAQAKRDRWAVCRARKATREQHEAVVRRCG